MLVMIARDNSQAKDFDSVQRTANTEAVHQRLVMNSQARDFDSVQRMARTRKPCLRVSPRLVNNSQAWDFDSG